jgi:formamidopyrimidine-DNA glycosylase
MEEIMIELPEAITIARQITTELKGKQIDDGNRGNSPHKFAFTNRSAEEYAAILPGKVVGEASANGSMILMPVEPGYTVVLGEGGERINYHPSAATLPKKYQLFLHFSDDSYLTVTVQGWGATFLMDPLEVANHPYFHFEKPSPLSENFTLEYFQELFETLKPEEKSSVKFFMISKPGVLGIGNGCLQDILWRAKIHPRRRAVSLTLSEQQALYNATRNTLRQMVEAGGRDGDYDLYDRPGGYKRILHSKAVDTPCPVCGAPIQKAAYLGGAIYFCPRCQVES